MTHFEPASSELGEFDEKTFRLQNHYSDEELLVELRRRGRLARIEGENIAPERFVSDGMPVSYQIERVWRQIAEEAARRHVSGTKPTGEKVENVMGDGLAGPRFETGRRVRFALNYVVDRRS